MRFKDLQFEEMNEAQQAVHRHACDSPRGRLGPPTNLLLRCPQLAIRSQQVGDYLRFGSSLPSRISEFAIIISGRYWSAPYEWNTHCQLAIKAGLGVDTATALAQGRRSQAMQEDEAAVYDFCTQLHRHKAVSDDAFSAALKHFGETGVIDLAGIAGYYTVISMCLRLNPRDLPPGIPPVLEDLPNDRVFPADAADISATSGPDRFPELDEAAMSDAQRAVVREILAGPAGKLTTPVKVMLRSPELARRVQKVSEYLKFERELPARLMQLAVIIAARYCRAETMWHAHSRSAVAEGLSESVVADMVKDVYPSGMRSDEEAVYRFCTQLHEDKSVDDEAFGAVLKILGERGTVEVMAVCGYYTLAGMMLKLARKAVPAG
jgi:4-carboxymuconolactone decarboxylase